MKSKFVRVGLFTLTLSTFSANAVASDFFQGFESDNSGWDVFGGSFNAARVATGTGGITAATGSFYGQAGTSATNWGGYNSSMASTGFITAVDIYLDMDGGWANDTRFDYSSAINDNTGVHRRDFIFNAGFYNDAGPVGSGNRFVFSASNNSPGWPQNPGRDPFAVTTTGWYTMEHSFAIVGGVLSVDMTLRSSGGTALHSWTLSDTSDLAAVIGGNRYGWFSTNGFGTLAIDNSRRYSASPVPEPFTMGLGIAAVGLALRRRSKSKTA